MKIYRKRIGDINGIYGIIPGQKRTDTHIVSFELTIEGDVYSSSPIPLEPRDLKKVYNDFLKHVEVMKKGR